MSVWSSSPTVPTGKPARKHAQRLSIVDISRGGQPLANGDGTAWIIGKGEIYSHEDLSAKLPPGLLQTQSDTEAALHLVMREGPASVAELSGMFALAMVTATGDGLVARDPMGVKPLYWIDEPDATMFASELRAFGPEDRPRVASFPPGCLWTAATSIVRYANSVPGRRPPSPPGAVPELGQRGTPEGQGFRSAVRAAANDGRRRGGCIPLRRLDSAIVAEHTRRRGGMLPTFAVGTKDSSDLLAARPVAEFIGSDHYEVVATAESISEELDNAVEVIEHNDPALVRSSVPNLLLAREAITAGRPEKAVLREAFTDWLPEELLWRRKEQFGDGSGAGEVLAELAKDNTAKAKAGDTDGAVTQPPNSWALRSDEEILYYRIWQRYFSGVRPNVTLGCFATL
jgi:asparagine synthetase B (glutamine-hydrolysing)